MLINSFWILGAAIILSAFSYHYWLAEVEGRRLREQLEQTSFQRFFWLGFTMIGVGLTGTSARVWETAVWVIFTLFSFIQVIKIR